MSLKKQYLKSRPMCKVTFRVCKEAANHAQSIHLVGDFNSWDMKAIPMKALKSGDFTATIDLPVDKPEYQFRYLYDQSVWENDWEADNYIPNGLNGDNSIVSLKN